jgi:hypothetical protein
MRQRRQRWRQRRIFGHIHATGAFIHRRSTINDDPPSRNGGLPQPGRRNHFPTATITRAASAIQNGHAPRNKP